MMYGGVGLVQAICLGGLILIAALAIFDYIMRR